MLRQKGEIGFDAASINQDAVKACIAVHPRVRGDEP